MFQNKSLLALLFILGCSSAALTGCSGYSSSGGGDGGNTAKSVTDDGNVDTKALEADLAKMETEMVAVEDKFSKIDIPVATIVPGASSSSLDTEVRALLEGFLQAGTKLFEGLNILELEIQTRVAKLDPSNANHAKVIEKLNKLLEDLRDLRGKMGDKVRALVVKAEAVVKKVDDKIEALDPKSPLKVVAGLLWSPVKAVLVEYRAKFLALAP